MEVEPQASSFPQEAWDELEGDPEAFFKKVSAFIEWIGPDGHLWCQHPSLSLALFFLLKHQASKQDFVNKTRLGRCKRCIDSYSLYRDTFSDPKANLSLLQNSTGLTVFRGLVDDNTTMFLDNVLDDCVRILAQFHSPSEQTCFAVYESMCSLNNLLGKSNAILSELEATAGFKLLTDAVRVLCLEDEIPVGIIPLAMSSTAGPREWARSILAETEERHPGSHKNVIKRFRSAWVQESVCIETRRYFRKPQTYIDFLDFMPLCSEESQTFALSSFRWLRPLALSLSTASMESVELCIRALSKVFELAALVIPREKRDEFLQMLTRACSKTPQCPGLDGEAFVEIGLLAFRRFPKEAVFKLVANLNTKLLAFLSRGGNSRNAAMQACIKEYSSATSVTNSDQGTLRAYTTSSGILASAELHATVRLELLRLVATEYVLTGEGPTEPGANIWPPHLFIMASEPACKEEIISLLVASAVGDCTTLFNSMVLLGDEYLRPENDVNLKTVNPKFWFGLSTFLLKSKSGMKMLDSNALPRMLAAFGQVSLLEKAPSEAAQHALKILTSVRHVQGAMIAFLKRELFLLEKTNYSARTVWCDLFPSHFAQLMCSTNGDVRGSSLRICQRLFNEGRSSSSILDILCGQEDALEKVLKSVSQACLQIRLTGIENSQESTVALLFWMRRIFDLMLKNTASIESVKTEASVLMPILDFFLEIIQGLLQDMAKRGDLLTRCQDSLQSVVAVCWQTAEAQESLNFISHGAVSLLFDDKQCAPRYRESFAKVLIKAEFFNNEELANFLFSKAASPGSGVDKSTVVSLQKVALKRFNTRLNAAETADKKEAIVDKMTKLEKARKDYLKARTATKRDREKNAVAITALATRVATAPIHVTEDANEAANKLFRRRDPIQEMYNYILQLTPESISEAGSKISGIKAAKNKFSNIREYAEHFVPYVWREVLAQIEKAMLDTGVPLAATVRGPPEKQKAHLHRLSLAIGRDSGRDSDVTENSLLLMRKVTDEKLHFEVLAKVVGVEGRRSGDRLVHVLFSSKKISKLPGPDSSLLVVPLASMVNAHRQLHALFGLITASPKIKGMVLDPNYHCPERNRGKVELSSELRKSLNESQYETVIKTIDSSAPFSIIQGPPGTGKTTTIIALVTAILGRLSGAGGNRVLVCAPSNSAVDEIQVRLMKRGIYPLGSSGPCCPRTVRVGTASSSAEVEAISAFSMEESNPDVKESKIRREAIDCQLEALSKQILELERAIGSHNQTNSGGVGTSQLAADEKRLRKAQKSKIELSKKRDEETKLLRSLTGNKERMKKATELIDQSTVVFATLSSCGLECLRAAKKAFSHVVVDEAGQSIEPEVLIPLTGLTHKPKRCLLVGDTKQLPATVLSKHKGSSEVLGKSLMERIETRESKDTFFMLRRQYRMHPVLSAFPNTAFYKGNLRDDCSVTQSSYQKLYHRDMRGRFGPLTFYDTSGVQRSEERTHDKSYRNSHEASIVVRVLTSLFKRFNVEDPIKNVAIICPYRGQVNEVRRKIRSDDNLRARDNIQVTTVDGVQGREVDIVVLTTVRGRGNGAGGIGFVAEPRRMNVAITRPRHSLILIGNGAALSTSDVWKTYLESMYQHGVILRAQHERELEIIFSPDSGELRGPLPISTQNVEYEGINGGRCSAKVTTGIVDSSIAPLGQDNLSLKLSCKDAPSHQPDINGNTVTKANRESSLGKNQSEKIRISRNLPTEENFNGNVDNYCAAAGDDKRKATDSSTVSTKRQRTAPIDALPAMAREQREKLPLLSAPPCPSIPSIRGRSSKSRGRK